MTRYYKFLYLTSSLNYILKRILNSYQFEDTHGLQNSHKVLFVFFDFPFVWLFQLLLSYFHHVEQIWT